jgi:hypothetical protein
MYYVSQFREAPNKIRLKSSVWLENELKAYQWFIVAMSGCRGILIQNYVIFL